MFSPLISTFRRKNPFFGETVRTEIGSQIAEALNLAAIPPQTRQTKAKPRWTLKRLVVWIEQKYQIDCCRETVRKALKQIGFSWKKAKKLLNKGNTAKRKEFLGTITELLDYVLHQNQLLVYIDEAHVHLDTDEGYGWSIQGERFWISSSSPGRTKVSFYGIYVYNQATSRIFSYEKAEKVNTIDVLKKLRVEFLGTKMTVVWDGAPYHRAKLVREAASALDIRLQPLPAAEAKPLSRLAATAPQPLRGKVRRTDWAKACALRPDFMPVEHLWQWLRENITYHICYDSRSDLIDAVADFQERINTEPIAISDRLWVKKHLEPEEEKLRFPK